MKINIKYLTIIWVGLFFSWPTLAQNNDINQTTFSFGGYAKMDMLYSKFNNGEVKDISPMRDFYFPGLIPVGSESLFEYTDFHVKESRFNFDLRSDIDGHRIRGFMEMDFMLSGVGNEKVSNSFNPRLRHFFFEYDNILVGQTWSTFMTVILPEGIDFIGVPEGMVFIRQPQLRLSLGSWQFALENPTTTVTSYQSITSRLRSSGGTPDLVIRKNIKGDWGTLSGSAIARTLSLVDTAGVKKREPGFGFSLGGKLFIGKKNDIRFMTTAGSGLGRYVGLNFVSSSVLCEQNDIHAIKTVNGYLALRHQWTQKLRSNVSVAGFYADHETTWTGSDVNKSVWSGSVNLLYNPISNVMFGIEWMHAERELQSGDTGSFERIQISGKYSFKYSSK
jgi:hypothetical protein